MVGPKTLPKDSGLNWVCGVKNSGDIGTFLILSYLQKGFVIPSMKSKLAGGKKKFGDLKT